MKQNDDMYQYPFRTAPKQVRLEVWNKGRAIPNEDPRVWRLDAYGTTIQFFQHGNTNSLFGWEIDHKTPVAYGGNGDLSNLQPLQWQNNRKKGDNVS